jgi:hypothetical protein
MFALLVEQMPVGAPGGYFGNQSSGDEMDNMVVGTSSNSIQQMGMLTRGLKQKGRVTSLSQIPKEPKAVTPYYGNLK